MVISVVVVFGYWSMFSVWVVVKAKDTLVLDLHKGVAGI